MRFFETRDETISRVAESPRLIKKENLIYPLADDDLINGKRTYSNLFRIDFLLSSYTRFLRPVQNVWHYSTFGAFFKLSRLTSIKMDE